jgi:hypothetical protein
MIIFLDKMYKKWCFIATAFQLYFSKCHYEGPGKPDGTEIKWNTSAAVDVTLLGENIDLSLYGSTSLVHPDSYFSFLIYAESAGLLGRAISPSQGLYLHTGQHKRTQITTHREGFETTIPLFERAWSLWPAGNIDTMKKNTETLLALVRRLA